MKPSARPRYGIIAGPAQPGTTVWRAGPGRTLHEPARRGGPGRRLSGEVGPARAYNTGARSGYADGLSIRPGFSRTLAFSWGDGRVAGVGGRRPEPPGARAGAPGGGAGLSAGW